jgi:hypothetical protein
MWGTIRDADCVSNHNRVSDGISDRNGVTHAASATGTVERILWRRQ